jgi:hypothetical protein
MNVEVEEDKNFRDYFGQVILILKFISVIHFQRIGSIYFSKSLKTEPKEL